MSEETHDIDTAEHTEATARLRAFEDEKLGTDAVRIHGHIERGFGSKFRDLSEEDRAHHAKLEKLVDAEAKLAAAKAALVAAETEYAEAEKAVDNG